MSRQSLLLRKFFLFFILLSGIILLPSCDWLFKADGDTSVGIESKGGYYYFVDNTGGLLSRSEDRVKLHRFMLEYRVKF